MQSRSAYRIVAGHRPVVAIALLALGVATLLGACAQGEEGGEAGQTEEGAVTLSIVSPGMGETVPGPSVAISFDLQNHEVYFDSTTGMGQHIHVILDNEP